MVDDEIDLDELMSDKFLDSLNDEGAKNYVEERPDWVNDDENHTTYKSWQAILAFKEKKEISIKNYGKIADKKTSKYLYEISKSEVSKVVGVSPQSIFRASKFSQSVLDYFDSINAALLKKHEKEQVKQKKRQINTGIRSKKKIIIVKSHQEIEKELNQLKAKTTKEVLDLAINQMPLDLKLKLGF
jgi:ABC-type sugar transport system ATPase subunit